MLAAGRVDPVVVAVLADVALAGAREDVADDGPAEVSFSRALVRERTGLSVVSPSLLKGEPISDLFPASFPDSESPDRTLPEIGRTAPRAGAVETRPPGGLVGPLAVLPMVDVTADDCLLGPAAGKAGGPIDVLVPPTDGRALPAPNDETRGALDGVPVLEFARLEAAVASCFVGDLVGDCWAKVSTVKEKLH